MIRLRFVDDAEIPVSLHGLKNATGCSHFSLTNFPNLLSSQATSSQPVETCYCARARKIGPLNKSPGAWVSSSGTPDNDDRDACIYNFVARQMDAESFTDIMIKLFEWRTALNVQHFHAPQTKNTKIPSKKKRHSQNTKKRNNKNKRKRK